jgi:hypothetical protein
MRAIIKKDSPPVTVDAPARLDLREDPGSVASIDAARRHPALRGLLLNLNEDESPFETFGCKVWTTTDDTLAEPHVFASRVDLLLSGRSDQAEETHYEDLVRRLAELLEREPGDALRAELQIAPWQFAGGHQGFCLRLLLFAHAAAAEQARLRWTLGIARVQQALLFLARAIRQNR